MVKSQWMALAMEVEETEFIALHLQHHLQQWWVTDQLREGKVFHIDLQWVEESL